MYEAPLICVHTCWSAPIMHRHKAQRWTVLNEQDAHSVCSSPLYLRWAAVSFILVFFFFFFQTQIDSTMSGKSFTVPCSWFANSSADCLFTYSFNNCSLPRNSHPPTTLSLLTSNLPVCLLILQTWLPQTHISLHWAGVTRSVRHNTCKVTF